MYVNIYIYIHISISIYIYIYIYIYICIRTHTISTNKSATVLRPLPSEQAQDPSVPRTKLEPPPLLRTPALLQAQEVSDSIRGS